jgi:hypothetical protein
MAKIVARFTKSPSERKRYDVDYSQWLEGEEVITGAVATVFPDSSSADSTPVFVDSIVIFPGATGIAFFANAGTAGRSYKLRLVTQTTLTEIKEDGIVFVVTSGVGS